MRKYLILFTALLLLVCTPLFAEEPDVRTVVVSPSRILTEKEINSVIESCSEQYSGVQLLEEVVNALNGLYLEKGFPNALAYVPEQNVENGIVRIELLEGKVGEIKVQGNSLTSEKYILDYLEMEKGEILNLGKFEKKLISFNRWNSGASISSELNPGEETGTTDITINTEEEFPMRAFLTFDNYASQALGKVRYGAHVSSAFITPLREAISSGVYFSEHLITPYADASIGLGTRLRLGATFSYGTTHAEAIKEAAIDFGSNSLSNGLYGTYNIFRDDHANLGLNASFDYSRSSSELLDVAPLTEHVVYSGHAGFSFTFAGDRFILSTSLTASGSKEDTDDSIYYKFTGSSFLNYRLGNLIFLVINSTYQIMPLDMYVPDWEKIYIGGASTVRGYSEGNTIWGKEGYTLSTEFRFYEPANRRSYFFLFADHGGVFTMPDTGENFLFSFGGGLVLCKGNWLTINFAAGMNAIPVTQDIDHPTIRAHIGVTINTP